MSGIARHLTGEVKFTLPGSKYSTESPSALQCVTPADRMTWIGLLPPANKSEPVLMRTRAASANVG
ncbi:hypothetical protein [Lysobacter sp. CA199]|uniref:hypothetical protein n=1 Tax=Lysobacter sp. CA199 TaxID=3455608 RepID=UPI003F8D3DFE